MTPHQIELVEISFAGVSARRTEAGRLFYEHLFEAAPDLRPMFKGDIAAQGEKLVDTLGAIVEGLSDIEKLLPVVSQLASRHRQYGTRPEHYPLVGDALIRSLRETLGPRFTGETAAAWAAAYAALSEAMIDAAHPELVVAKLSAAE
jgi:nitric oxide dioxygenase